MREATRRTRSGRSIETTHPVATGQGGTIATNTTAPASCSDPPSTGTSIGHF